VRGRPHWYRQRHDRQGRSGQTCSAPPWPGQAARTGNRGGGQTGAGHPPWALADRQRHHGLPFHFDAKRSVNQLRDCHIVFFSVHAPLDRPSHPRRPHQTLPHGAPRPFQDR